KTAAFELAAEQLERWRTWSVFTSYNIARMDEVELTSELLILMIDGISEKSATVIDRYYKKFDDKLHGRDELAKRYRFVFECMAEALTDEERQLFKKRTLFYCLFAAFYDLAFGIGSDVSAKKAQAIKPVAVK